MIIERKTKLWRWKLRSKLMLSQFKILFPAFSVNCFLRGCHDKSDIQRDATTEEIANGHCFATPQPKECSPDPIRFPLPDIRWHLCKKAKKCILEEAWCDMHPHYACEDGEDETDCLEVYKTKGYISQSAFFTCQSLYHNEGNNYENSSKKSVY